jgi:CO/xanthine dehydrogenase FAD-binding subunit
MDSELLVPRSLTELRQVAGSGRLIAGGTDLLVQIRAGRHEKRLIDLTNLADRPPPVAARDGVVEISGLAPIAVVVRELQGRLPAIAAAARLFGSVQIRNRATLGGNLANASPAGDMFPPLIAAGAQVVIERTVGSRVIPVTLLATGPGRTVLAADEWISVLRVPLPGGEEGFIKLGGRAAMAISIISLAWRWTRRPDGSLADVSLALGAVASTAIRAPQAEAVLEGRRPTVEVVDEAAAAIRASVAPIDDLRGSAWYRQQVSGDLLRQALGT